MAGIAMAGFITLDMLSGADLAAVLAASGLVYLGAAAFGKRSAAWPLFFGTFIIITITKVGLTTINATWIFLSFAALFAVYGFLRGTADPIEGLPIQTVAMVGFGAAAAIALTVRKDVGAYMVAAGLLGHAAWDLYHHRVNKVVTRSMAEFCGVLDTLLVVAIVFAALRS